MSNLTVATQSITQKKVLQHTFKCLKLDPKLTVVNDGISTRCPPGCFSNASPWAQEPCWFGLLLKSKRAFGFLVGENSPEEIWKARCTQRREDLPGSQWVVAPSPAVPARHSPSLPLWHGVTSAGPEPHAHEQGGLGSLHLSHIKEPTTYTESTEATCPFSRAPEVFGLTPWVPVISRWRTALYLCYAKKKYFDVHCKSVVQLHIWREQPAAVLWDYPQPCTITWPCQEPFPDSQYWHF